jgi:porphobilinogen deaminase
VLDVVVLSPDGAERIADSSAGERSAAAEIGRRAAENLLDRGAAKLLGRERRSVSI